MYKSYLLIAGLALFMLFIAGTLLKTGESAGAPKPNAAAARERAKRMRDLQEVTDNRVRRAAGAIRL